MGNLVENIPVLEQDYREPCLSSDCGRTLTHKFSDRPNAAWTYESIYLMVQSCFTLAFEGFKTSEIPSFNGIYELDWMQFQQADTIRIGAWFCGTDWEKMVTAVFWESTASVNEHVSVRWENGIESCFL